MADKSIIDESSGNHKKVVVGVDFGTNGTGFSFSFTGDTGKTVHNFQDWDDCGDARYCKNLSSILYERSEEIASSWGYTAEREYLTQDEDSDSDSDSDVASSVHQSPTQKVLFKQFKNHMKKNPHGNISENGLELPLTKVISDYLYFVKELIMDRVTTLDANIDIKDIRWCFSVPVVWEEIHKKQLRKIAFEAGFIDDENCQENDFLMVSEPEAAAIYCIDNDMKTGAKSLKPGQLIMIVDAGGGTVDLTVHTLDTLQRLKTVTIPSGNTLGSTALDDEFLSILRENFGEKNMDNFKKENPLMFLELMSNWEKAKRDAKDFTKSLKLNVPPKLMKIGRGSPMMNEDTGKLILSVTHVERIFKTPINDTIQQVKKQLSETKKTARKTVDYIFLVGGFGQNEILRKRLKEECEKGTTKIVMPKFCGEAVVNGACMLGRDPSLIQTRRSRYSYGIEVEQPFNPSIHESGRCVAKHGEYLCTGVFKTYAKRGQEVETDKTQRHTFFIAPNQAEVEVKIYFSPKERVKYVDEVNVAQLLIIPIKVEPKNGTQEVGVLMKFGKAEVIIEVELEDGTVTQGKAKFSSDSLKLC